MFTLKIETDSDAMQTNMYGEIARILREVAQDVDNHFKGGSFMDSNGNTVGSFQFTNSPAY